MTDNSKATEKSKSEVQEGDLETVRDILFGAQIRKADQQRETLAKEFNDTIVRLKKSTDDQFKSLKDDIQALRQEQDNKTQALGQSLAELDKATSRAEADLADQIDTNISTLNTQMENWKEELFSQLDQVQQHLMHDKTDRGTLADMFSVMPEQLMKESAPKKKYRGSLSCSHQQQMTCQRPKTWTNFLDCARYC